MARYRLRTTTWTVVREPGEPSPRKLTSPEVAGMLAIDLAKTADDDREHFWVIVLDAQNQYRTTVLVSTGTQTSSLVHPREVFRPVIAEGGVSVLLVHNHSSGDPAPSREDLRLTRRLRNGGQLLDIKVHDHIIVGNGTWNWVSLAQRGAL